MGLIRDRSRRTAPLKMLIFGLILEHARVVPAVAPA